VCDQVLVVCTVGGRAGAERRADPGVTPAERGLTARTAGCAAAAGASEGSEQAEPTGGQLSLEPIREITAEWLLELGVPQQQAQTVALGWPNGMPVTVPALLAASSRGLDLMSLGQVMPGVRRDIYLHYRLELLRYGIDSGDAAALAVVAALTRPEADPADELLGMIESALQVERQRSAPAQPTGTAG
jgi:hypothetical protein